MPEVREVFRMATERVRPDPGFVQRQHRNQRRRVRRRSMAAAAMVAVFGVAAIAIVIAVQRHDGSPLPGVSPPPTGSRPPQAIPSAPFTIELSTGEMRPLPDSLSGGFSYALSPDGSTVVFGQGTWGGCMDLEWVTIANIDGSQERTLGSPTGLNICGARWSPDGASLVYQEKDGADDSLGNLFVENVDTRQRRQVTDLELPRAAWWFLAPTFTADGGDILFHLPRTPKATAWDVWSVPVAGGEPTLVIRDAMFPVAFPDGSRIAFLSPRGDDFTGASIQVSTIDGGDRRTLVEGGHIWWPTMSPDGTRIAYEDGGLIYVVDVGTGLARKVVDGQTAEWLDDDTLIVADLRGRRG